MKSINILLDKGTKYSIEVKEEYSPKEFISSFEGHIEKIKKICAVDTSSNIKTIKTETRELKYRINHLFRSMDEKIASLGKDIQIQDSETMRTFSSYVKTRNRNLGLAWLAPVGNSLIIYLRKGDHSRIDKKGKIIYSNPSKRTFGDYPMMKINREDELVYALEIIRNIYQAQ